MCPRTSSSDARPAGQRARRDWYPAYVPRDRDEQIDQALTGGGLVIVAHWYETATHYGIANARYDLARLKKRTSSSSTQGTSTEPRTSDSSG